MFRKGRAILGVAAVWLGLTVMPANAVQTRIFNFLFACDGTNKSVPLTATTLPASTTLLIVATELVLFENQGALQYVLVAPNGDRTKQLANMGLPPSARQSGGGDHVFNQSPYGLASVTSNAAGNVSIAIDGACNPGFGQVQGTVTMWFVGPGL